MTKQDEAVILSRPPIFAMNIRLSLFSLICLLSGCVSSAQNYTGDGSGREKPSRALMQRSDAVVKAPAKYEMRQNSKGKYDPKPRVVIVDDKAGKYELRWIGYDGKEKVIAYQRHDALDASVEATVVKENQNLVYKYLIRNLPTSPSHVGAFKVQTFASDVRDERVAAGEDIHIGHMSRHIPQFSEGQWRAFAPLGEANWIKAGMNREFQIRSRAQPGVVKCYARSGEPSLKGVGEHMPYELEMAMPGFEELASCITIGPVERLSTLSAADRVEYLLENLPEFVKAGWMDNKTRELYDRVVRAKGISGLIELIKSDLKDGLIAPEVFHIVEGLAIL